MSRKPVRSRSFQSDFVGRIGNIALSPSPSNALAPLYEAVTNSIQAIEDRFGENGIARGKIRISVLRPMEPSDAPPNGFEISDNGIGMNDDNFEAFATSDTRYKIKKGGKGVGRFLWIKVFEKAHVLSAYNKGGRRQTLSFDFAAADTQQIRNILTDVERSEIGTTVTLAPFRPEYGTHCPRKPSTIKNKIVGHFISLFINSNRPSILLSDVDGETNLSEEFSSIVEREQPFDIEIEREGGASLEFKLHAFLLPKEYSDDEKGVNAIFYGANGRTVRRFDVDGALGLKQIDGRFAYYGFVEGGFQRLGVGP